MVATLMFMYLYSNGFHNTAFVPHRHCSNAPALPPPPPPPTPRRMKVIPNRVIQRQAPDVIIQHFITHRHNHFDYGFGSKRLFFFFRSTILSSPPSTPATTLIRATPFSSHTNSPDGLLLLSNRFF